MSFYHQIDETTIADGILSLKVDGRFISKALFELYPVLDKASETELSHFEISPSGYGIHWPLLDEDLSIDGLLGIVHSPAQWKISA